MSQPHRIASRLPAALLASVIGLSLHSAAWSQQQPASDTAEEEPATPAPRSAPLQIAPPRTAPRPPAPAPARPPARPAPAAAQAPAQPAPASVSQPATATLPNGASAINEIYGDWTVDCRLSDGQKACVLTQSQGNSQNNQRVFAIELRTPAGGKTEGAILMPFGLRLENGAILRLDDKDLGQGLRFSTCVPAGCLLPVSFPTIATDAMKTGKTLTAAALNLSTGEPVAFNISLNGFSAALARITQLGA